MKAYFDKEIIDNNDYIEFYEKLNSLESNAHYITKPLLYEEELLLEKDDIGIIALNFGKKIYFIVNNIENEFKDNIIMIINELIGRFEYRKYFGTPMQTLIKLKKLIVVCTIEEYIIKYNTNDLERLTDVEDEELRLDLEVISSLLKGNIIESSKLKELYDPEKQNIISYAKNRILSFDTDQTKFIFPLNEKKKMMKLQGVAGSGKTEMLLHRLRTLYSDNIGNDDVIAFTCKNNVLANEMRNHRIIDFFNSMKFNKQIEWNKKLFCFGAWGSKLNPDRGLYSYICKYYGIKFYNFSMNSNFTEICNTAKNEIINNKLIEEFGYAFQYLLIDEGQDLPESFIELCEYITEKKLYVAGDIYQNIFNIESRVKSNPDCVLSKVYRTNSELFMFAHLFSLGYFTDVIRWMDKEELEYAGYNVLEEDEKFIISREKIERYPRLNDDNKFSCSMVNTIDDVLENIVSDMKKVIGESEGILAKDIAIIVVSSYMRYEKIYIPKIKAKIESDIGFEIQTSIEGNELNKEKIYLTNQNKVKGLEFPYVFVIFDEKNIKSGTNEYLTLRNAFYMASTRSLISSFTYIWNTNGTYDGLEEKINEYKKNNELEIIKPSDDDIKKINSKVSSITYQESLKPAGEIIMQVIKELNINPEKEKMLYQMAQAKFVGNEVTTEDEVRVWCNGMVSAGLI